MGQKVNPLGFRLGVSQKHISHWFIDNNHYSQLVVEDQFIRNFFYKKFSGIASIDIKRDLNRIAIEVFSANTRDLLMEGGKMTAKVTLSSSAQVDVNKSSAEKTNSTEGASSSSVQSTVNSGADSANNLCDQLLKELTAYRNTRLKKILKSSSKKTTSEIDSSTAKASSLQKKQNNAIPPSDGKNLTEFSPPVESNMLKKTMEVELFWTKVENPNTSAACLAEFIVEQLEKRVPFRRVLKRSIQKAEEASVSGIKVQISGRLNGAEIARSERIHKGQVPLHTLRAKIEYNSRTAKTIYGLLGVKVWVFNGFADLNQVKLLT